VGGSAHKVVAQSSVTALSKPAPPTMTQRVCVCVCECWVLGGGVGRWVLGVERWVWVWVGGIIKEAQPKQVPAISV
jgi:hypothetical protein